MKKIFLFSLITILVMSSCGSSKKTASTKKVEKSKETVKVSETVKTQTSGEELDFNVLKYIAKFKDISKKEMKDYGVPTSITLAQGILESQSGNSDLAINGNNHFGIKCHKNWRGQTIYHDDDESQECFRKYLNPEESFKDHSQFLATRKRYAFLFRLPKTDYEAWARGLKKAGYATDPSYPEKLIYIIEKYDLSKFDNEVLESMSVKVDKSDDLDSNKKKKFVYEVKEGETLFTISQKYNIPVKDIQRINNLNDFDIYEGQIIVLTENDGTEEALNESNISLGQNNQENTTEETPETLTTKNVDIALNESADNNTEKVIEEVSANQENIQKYTVKEGETLFSIAKDKNLDIEDLKTANNLLDNNINVGDVIVIPLDKVKKEVETPAKTVVDETVDDKQYHIVQPKETLYRIHINYGVSIKKLRKLNNLKGNYIKVGQKLRIK